MSQGEVCIANIGPRQRRLRLLTGVGLLIVTAGLLGTVILTDAPRLLRIGVFLPAFVGALGVAQAREKT